MLLLSMSNPRTRQLATGSLSFIVYFLFSIFCASSTFALDPSLDISQYAHTSWRIREGFTRGYIGAIAQTRDGYLWLGTPFGMVRFDGVRAVPWQPPGGQQLPDNGIRQLFLGRDGTLWIGTNNGLASWKDGKLAQYPKTAGIVVQDLMQDHEGTIWLAGEVTGHSPVQPRVCAVERGQAQCWGEETFAKRVTFVYEDRKQNLWVGGPEDLWRGKPAVAQHFNLSKDMGGLHNVTEDENGAFILAGPDGLRQFVDGKVRKYALPGIHFQFTTRRFLHGGDGSLWIITVDSGVIRVHRGKADWFSEKDGLTSNTVLSAFEDREGNIWVATTAGLDRFRDYAVTTISNKQGLAAASSWSVVAGKDGGVWVASFDGVTNFHNGRVTIYEKAYQTTGSRSQTVQSPTDIVPRRISNSGLLASSESLFQDREGKIWVTSKEGVVRWDGNRFSRVTGLPGGSVYGIDEDSHETVWLNNEQHGLIRASRDAEVEAIPWSRLGQSDVGLSMAVDPSQGGLWLGFVHGMTYWKDGQVRRSYGAKDGLGDGWVKQLRFGTRGTLWAATQGGLSRIKDGRVTTLTSKNGLPCDSVHWSVEDGNHYVWLYMRCGLVRIARPELDAWVADPNHKVQTTAYDVTDGVSLPATIGGFGPHVSKAPDGKIWFPVVDGVSVIDPLNLHDNKIPPPVHIEQVTADGKVYGAADGVRLPKLVRYVDIDYTALSLVVPEKVRFRVKLEGEDKDWRELVNVRRVSYTNLGPKHYRFLVKACNNSGVWNEEGAALDFVIPPAWYQTYWFFAACVAAFLALLWALYQYRLHQLAQQFNMRLEERVGERTRIARDLHDTLLQSFHGILLFLQSGIHLLDEHPAEAKKTLKTAAEQAERAIIEGREAVQGLRASTVERNDLALAIKTLGGELAAADSNSHRAEFNVQVEGIPHELHPILRDEVFRIGGEAMRNAFRHADAKQIEVEIRYDERQLRLRVRDDGKGIDPKLLSHDGREGHFGLRGMRERAKLIGGKLTVWSELDSGTEVELSIPASRAYTAPGDGQRSWLAEKFAKISQRDTERKS
ncbi:MAG TPA: two-component regulator propeller domain-containing protein [Methylomirabilota bacterium]|nr:two-component regulator propeller domain-containing protein [Methylomirabilota bacterium]